MEEAVECIRDAKDHQMFQSAVASLREYYERAWNRDAGTSWIGKNGVLYSKCIF